VPAPRRRLACLSSSTSSNGQATRRTAHRHSLPSPPESRQACRTAMGALTPPVAGPEPPATVVPRPGRTLHGSHLRIDDADLPTESLDAQGMDATLSMARVHYRAVEFSARSEVVRSVPENPAPPVETNCSTWTMVRVHPTTPHQTVSKVSRRQVRVTRSLAIRDAPACVASATRSRPLSDKGASSASQRIGVLVQRTSPSPPALSP
jgi:hypothetical protein